MSTAPDHAPAPTLRESFDTIASFAETWRVGDDDMDFMKFERELNQRMGKLQRELLEVALQNADIDAKRVTIDGVEHRRIQKSEMSVTTTAGPVRVTHTLYRPRGGGSRPSVSALARRAGLVAGFTPEAASLALFVVTELVPEKAEELFARMDGMTPSKSTLDRLPKRVSERWEGRRGELEPALREASTMPALTTTLAVSLDGVMAPMKDGARASKRADAKARGATPRGPAGYREAGVATVTYCNEVGTAEGAVRMARRPESKKGSLKAMLKAEVTWALKRDPDLRVVKIADGAEDNWTFLRDELPPGVEVIDFWHAAQHLNDALVAAYGDGPKAERRFADLRWVLRDDPDGVKKVIRSLDYLKKRHPANDVIRRALNYFRKHKSRMQYRSYSDEGLPIGSGMVEAACKTLVAQRLKRSGMAWSDDGAQAILTPRGWSQSGRFDAAWALLAATYRADVSVVVPVDEEAQVAEIIPFPHP